MERFDTLHEKHHAIMAVDAPRTIRANEYKSVSGPHYETFFADDLSVEAYTSGGGGASNQSVRLFSRDNLTAPKTSDDVYLDINAEKKVFDRDSKLQELFVRMATNATNGNDWKNSRPKSLSCVHESIRTHIEFQKLAKSIEDNFARLYLKEKTEMNKIITADLQLEK